jgi:hypothetical protein
LEFGQAVGEGRVRYLFAEGRVRYLFAEGRVRYLFAEEKRICLACASINRRSDNFLVKRENVGNTIRKLF